MYLLTYELEIEVAVIVVTLQGARDAEFTASDNMAASLQASRGPCQFLYPHGKA